MLIFRDDIQIEKIDSKIKILLNNQIYGVIEWPVYNLLYALNGMSKEDALTFLEKYVYKKSDAKELLDKILDYYCPIIKDCDYKNDVRNIPYFGKADSKLNINRIRSFLPKTLVLQVTKKCPMKCKYCYAGSNLEYSNQCAELSLDIIERVLQEATNLGITKIDLTGGDPFARDDILDILNLFDNYGIKTSLSTKIILSDNIIMELKNYKCIDEIQISIDSIKDEEVYKLLGINNYVKNHLSFISKLVKLGINVKTNSVLTRFNIDNIPLLIDKLKQLEVKKIVLSPYMSNLFNRNEDFFPSVEQYKKLSTYLTSKLNDKLIEYPNFLNNFTEESLYYKLNNSCGACLDGFIISVTGDVFICERMSYFDKYSIGNIKSQSIINIWNSKEIYKYYLLQRNLFKEEKCFDCVYFNHCVNSRGICFVHSLVLNGRLYSPDSSCLIQEKKERIY